MTNEPEYLLDGEPLSVCATHALLEALESGHGAISLASQRRKDAILTELATRTGPGWEPYGGMCVP